LLIYTASGVHGARADIANFTVDPAIRKAPRVLSAPESRNECE
jgi:hypothetical protein